MAQRSLITPVAILSYPALFEPRAVNEGDEPKYSASLVFTEGTDLTELKKAAVETAKEKWGTKAEGMIRAGKLRMPFRTDGEEKGYPAGSTFLNARTTRRPGVVSRIPDPTTGRPMPIDDPEELYPGALVKASLVPFAYDVSGNKGVSFSLGNVQKWGDGERLDGRTPAEQEFEADTELADLSDLTDEKETVVTGSIEDLL